MAMLLLGWLWFGTLAISHPSDFFSLFFFFQAEDGIRDWSVTGVQTCALPILTYRLLLHEATGDLRYRDAALIANRYVRRTIRTDGDPNLRGAVQGSFPLWGEIGRASCRERV